MSSRHPAVFVDATIVLEALFGTAKVRATPPRAAVWVGSELLEVELYRSVDAMRLRGQLDDLETARKHAELSLTLAGLHLFPVSTEVIQKARAPFPIPVRALHALHAATAQVVQSEAGALEFWTRDPPQAAAAVTLGLVVRGAS